MSPSDAAGQRLHPVAALISVLRTLRGLLPLVIVALVAQPQDGSPLILIAAVAAAVSLADGIGGWLRYRYLVENGELRVQRGFIVRQRILIPAERVQTVDVSAGLLQRLFGLVKVEVKTAAGTQVVMSAITRQSADSLRRELAREQIPTALDQRQAPRSEYSLSLRQLLLAASTSGRLGVILSGIAWLYSQVDDFVEEQVLEFLSNNQLADSLPDASPLLVAALVAVALVVAFLASVVAEVVRYGGFSVAKVGDELVIRRGLFERREVNISLDRIQAIRIVEGLLRQPLGYAALVVETAGHTEERGQSTELHPFLHESQWLSLLRDLTPEYAIDPPLTRPPRRALTRFMVRPVLLALLLCTLLALALPFGWLALPLLVVAPWLGFLAYRDAGVGTVGQVVLLRRRALRRVTALVRRQRVQFAETSGSFFQRRKRLASCIVAVASGTGGKHFSVPDLDAETALRLQLWCVGAADARRRAAEFG